MRVVSVESDVNVTADLPEETGPWLIAATDHRWRCHIAVSDLGLIPSGAEGGQMLILAAKCLRVTCAGSAVCVHRRGLSLGWTCRASVRPILTPALSPGQRPSCGRSDTG